MNKVTTSTPVDNSGKVKVNSSDTLEYLISKLTSAGGTITITEVNDGDGTYHINIEGVGTGVLSVTETGQIKVKNTGGATLNYINTVLSGSSGITITCGDNSIDIAFSGKLDNLSDVSGCTAAASKSMLIKDGGGWVPDILFNDDTDDDALGTNVADADDEIASRGQVNRYIANLEFGTIDGTGENYTESSMWRTKDIPHIQMSAHDDTSKVAGGDGYPPTTGLLSQEIGENTGGRNYTRYVVGTSIQTTLNGDMATQDPAYLCFGALVQEDYYDGNIFLDLILCNGQTAHSTNQVCDIKIYCHSFKSLTDLTAYNTDTETVTKSWLTAGHPGDFWIQYATCEFDASALQITDGYRLLMFAIVAKYNTDLINVIGARLRYKKKVVDIRIADSLIIVEP